MKLIETKKSPLLGKWCFRIRETDDINISTMLVWGKSMLTGTVYWNRVQYRDPKSPKFCKSSRQKHFKDGYWLITFWFTLGSDAVIFRLSWNIDTSSKL